LRNQVASKTAYLSIWDTAVGTGTQITEGFTFGTANDTGSAQTIIGIAQPPGGPRTYCVGLRTTSGGVAAIDASNIVGANPAFLMVEQL